ncbi:MAG: hypothetical protein ACUZ8O_03710 [Candidatus Anammoxibacter sp.]
MNLDRIFAHIFYRPFSIENYNPQFIVNPLERPVELPDSLRISSTSLLPSTLTPPGTSVEDFKEYLSKRESFLREFIALDYKHCSDIGDSDKYESAKSSSLEISNKIDSLLCKRSSIWLLLGNILNMAWNHISSFLKNI